MKLISTDTFVIGNPPVILIATIILPDDSDPLKVVEAN